MNWCVVCLGPRPLPAFVCNGYSYHRCAECGSVSVDPAPTLEELRSYYNTSYRVDPGSAGIGTVRKWRHHIREVRRYAGPAGTILEVGCSWGGFLAAARDAGLKACGVDLSAEAAAWARERHGLDAFGGPLEESPFADRAFDAVVLWHVLEHQLDPREFLRSCASRLKPGGSLMLTTPNAGSLIARLLGEAWEWATPPAHLHLLTPRALRGIFLDAGLRPVELSTRRGDARPFLAEALIGTAKRLERLRFLDRPSPGAAEGAAGLGRASGGVSVRHRMARTFTRACAGLSLPFQPLGHLGGRWLRWGPELLAVAVKNA